MWVEPFGICVPQNKLEILNPPCKLLKNPQGCAYLRLRTIFFKITFYTARVLFYVKNRTFIVLKVVNEIIISFQLRYCNACWGWDEEPKQLKWFAPTRHQAARKVCIVLQIILFWKSAFSKSDLCYCLIPVCSLKILMSCETSLWKLSRYFLSNNPLNSYMNLRNTIIKAKK